MDRLRRALGNDTPEQNYEPLEGGSERPDGEHIEDMESQKFSWTDYSVFLLLGVAMLWAWYDLISEEQMTFC
jgi:equilibrative nucleoside transporter 1/2/3